MGEPFEDLNGNGEYDVTFDITSIDDDGNTIVDTYYETYIDLCHLPCHTFNTNSNTYIYMVRGKPL